MAYIDITTLRLQAESTSEEGGEPEETQDTAKDNKEDNATLTQNNNTLAGALVRLPTPLTDYAPYFIGGLGLIYPYTYIHIQ
jgi:hypothetical protein